MYEVDVMSGNMLWEVKPIYSEYSAKKQAQRYCTAGSYALGLQLEDITNIPLLDIGKQHYYMNITFKKGVALYSIHKQKDGEKEVIPVTNKEFVQAYNYNKLSIFYKDLVYDVADFMMGYNINDII